jgi:transposase-like protein
MEEVSEWQTRQLDSSYSIAYLYALRKVTKNRSSFPNDDVILKIMHLAIRNAPLKWTMPFTKSIM